MNPKHVVGADVRACLQSLVANRLLETKTLAADEAMQQTGRQFQARSAAAVYIWAGPAFVCVVLCIRVSMRESRTSAAMLQDCVHVRVPWCRSPSLPPTVHAGPPWCTFPRCMPTGCAQGSWRKLPLSECCSLQQHVLLLFCYSNCGRLHPSCTRISTLHTVLLARCTRRLGMMLSASMSALMSQVDCATICIVCAAAAFVLLLLHRLHCSCTESSATWCCSVLRCTAGGTRVWLRSCQRVTPRQGLCGWM